ncbi:uncharacterized protein LOC143298538 [Babylonia areolata]|uniref:uncharacterized protein LOC143298538 n=1 Tax=Babylonia areolata TaxID=304850 RepID=UPI003FCFF1B7
MASVRLAKDVQYLQRHIDSQTNGQAQITEVDDNLEFLLLNIQPNDGYYKGAKVRFKIQFPLSYPDEVPLVLCLDKVYHPNIDTVQDREEQESDVCVSLLDEWEVTMGLDHVVMALLFLFYQPNQGDALSPYFDGSMDDREMAENIRRTLRGESVEGISWPRLLVDDGDDTDKEKVEKMLGLDDELMTTVSEVSNEDFVDGEVGMKTGENGDSDKLTSTQTASNDDNSGQQPLPSSGVLNYQNSALTDVFRLPSFNKDPPVICLDITVDHNCKTSAEGGKSCGESVGIGRLFSCSGCRAARIKALFSCFQGMDSSVQFQPTSFGALGGSTWDCADVD